MYPFVEIFGLKFALYDIFAFVGLVLQYFVFMYIVKKRGGFTVCAREVQLISVFCGAVGMKVLYALTRRDLWGVAPLNEIFGGGVFYGGLLATLVSGIAVLKIKGVDKAPYTDGAAVSLPLFHAFGRIGCFFSGCCYGIESEFGFVTYNATVSSCNGVVRFPVQLLSALLLFALSGSLFVLFKRNILKGKLLFVYLGAYSVGRFFIEFLRGDEIRGKIWIFSTSQFISICLLIFLSVCLAVKLKENKW